MLVSSPHLVNHAAIFSAVRDLLLFLIGFQDGCLTFVDSYDFRVFILVY